MKAMLLAAGRGERLRPLTDTVAKPLVQVGHCRLIEHHLLKLKQYGITEIIINVCYNKEQVMQTLGDGSHYGVSIQYSIEEGKCLGTAGGIFKALSLLGGEPFLLISADIYSDYPFSTTLLDPTRLAHVVLVSNPDFHGCGDYGLAADSQLTMLPPLYTYAGFAKISPVLLETCEPHIKELADLFAHAHAMQQITGELYRGLWFNVGTAKQLRLAREAALQPTR